MAHHDLIPLSRRAFMAAGAAATLAATQSVSHAQAPLRSGLIGCGIGGTHLLKAMAASGGAVLPVVCATRAGVPSPGVPVAMENDWRVLVNRTDLDAIFIATPDHLHAEMAAEALRAGKHVYVMPPFTRQGEEGRPLAALARKHDRVLHVGMEPSEQARWLAAENEIARTGAPLWIQAASAPADFMEDPCWQRSRSLSHGPAARQLFNMLYPLQYHLGLSAPERATALGGVFQGHPESTPDRLLMTLHYGGGATVVLECADKPQGTTHVRGLLGQIALPTPGGNNNLADDLRCFTAAIAGDRQSAQTRLRAACIAQETLCHAMEGWARWSSNQTLG